MNHVRVDQISNIKTVVENKVLIQKDEFVIRCRWFIFAGLWGHHGYYFWFNCSKLKIDWHSKTRLWYKKKYRFLMFLFRVLHKIFN